MTRRHTTMIMGAALLGISLGSTHAHALEPWMEGTPLPQASSQRLAVTADDGLVYLFGGRSTADSTDAYDPAADTFTALAPMPVTTAGACGDQLSDGRIVVYGGVEPIGFSYRSETQIYDPLADTWAMGSELSGTWACAAAADDVGNLHVFGGQSQQTRYAIYDGALDMWSLGPAIPQPQRRYAHGVARSADGRYFLFGGRFSEDTWSIFDPLAGTWTLAGNLPTPSVSGAWASDGERVFLMGGSNNAFNDMQPFYDTVWELDMVTEVWDPMQPTLVTGVREAAGAWVAGALHVFGGSDGTEVVVHQVALLEPGVGTGSSSGGSSGGESSGEGSGTSTDGGTSGEGSTGPGNDTSTGSLDSSGGTTGVSSLGGSSTGSADSGTTSGDTGGATDPGGCGCRASDGRHAPVWPWLVVVVGLPCIRRRRRARVR